MTRRIDAITLFAMFGLAAAPAALAQESTPTIPFDAEPDAPKASEPVDAAPRTVRPEDYARFESLGFRPVLSPNGTWIAYTVSRVDRTSELRVRMLATNETRTFDEGDRPTFSADGAWMAYAIGHSPDEREKLEKQKKPVENALGLLDLASGDVTEIKGVSSFSFNDRGSHLAMRRYGSDLVIRDLDTGIDTTFGNVGDFAWADDSSLVAWTIRTDDGPGSGVQVYDASSGRLRTLDSSDQRYRNLTWRDDATDLAVLREVASEKKDGAAGRGQDDDPTSHDVLVWRALDGAPSEALTYEPASADDMPEGYILSGSLRWTDSGDAMVLQLRETESPEAKDGDSKDEAAAPPEGKPDERAD
ncbi:MAG: PD40 domain-containing protein, partial [Phycisphaerales bacterium]|nr:PD40 domain-containing protein [Phycisphaerales bacterium]